MADAPNPHFNLWYEPWIEFERDRGRTCRLGIRDALVEADRLLAIYDSSPLAVVGTHRLLTAIVQDIYRPSRGSELKDLWKTAKFDASRIDDFGQMYQGRFDLFDEAAPFYQSAEIPLAPGKKETLKTVAYLAPQIPSGTAIVHFRHGDDDRQVFCPACAAKGLVIIPAFATSGGAGIKPSINGVPPVYLLPGGKTLFEKLFCSLVLPKYQPKMAAAETDLAWWRREALVPRSADVLKVGYLHSLTFPARRVRLHPEEGKSHCSLCGEPTQVGVRTMVFEMGESRLKDAETWQDPFAGYAVRPGKGPIPIRPQRGKALWREFSGLFLQHAKADADKSTIRPAVLEQAADLAQQGIGPPERSLQYRCIGMVTDMKAKIFEWIDADFAVPVSLLEDELAGFDVDHATEFAADCSRIINDVFRDCFGGKGKDAARYSRLRSEMLNAFWAELAVPFRNFILNLAETDNRDKILDDWFDLSVSTAQKVLMASIRQAGDDGTSLRERVTAENYCGARLYKRREKEKH